MALLASCGRVQGGDMIPTPAPGSTLTTALEVHQLRSSAAERAYRVRLHAVVTYYDPSNHLLFVQDWSDGIFVELNDIENLPMRAGDAVEVIGVTSAGFAPNVSNARIRVLGHSRLPVPKSGSFESAIRGREDCRWLELGGIVLHVAKGTGEALLTLAWGETTYEAHVLAPPESLMHLVDAEVKLRGVCGAMFNSRNQLLGFRLFVPGAECIRVLRAPSQDRFSIAPTSVAELLQFSREREVGHRVRLLGTVTYPSRSGPTWVQDFSGGVMLQDHDPVELATGDLVDVAGFPTIAGFGPVLRGAQLKRLQSGTPPAPARITAQDAMKGEYDGQLVQLEGTLVDLLRQPPTQVLVVKASETIFDANLSGGETAPHLEPGTRIRLTGICSVEVEQSHDSILPRQFRLLLRTPKDVEILGGPPWFAAGRVAPILAGAVIVMVTALAWAGLLRKRVRAQTFALLAQTVQLQAAHQRTGDALRKAREAESVELDSKQILELIARDEPVDLIVEHIAEAVALHCESAVCAILLGPPHGPRVCVAPALPAAWLEALNRIRLSSVSLSPDFREPRQFSDDPAWECFIDSQKPARFRTFCSALIVVDSATAGLIAAFFRNEKGAAEAQGAQLNLWCNIAALALERRRLHDQLSYRAQHDVLTGLPNRAMLQEKLEAEIERSSRGGVLLGVLYIDLDGFKQINDTYGHDAGDAVLRETAKRMSEVTRRGDTVARIGGDEFVVLLPLLGRREEAGPIADKIARMLCEPMYSNQQRLSVSACIGIAIWPFDGDGPGPLLRFADAQMYGAKRRRRFDAPPKSQPGTIAALDERELV
jgi:diguanylate cyclase (GGDEF)-like protein